MTSEQPTPAQRVRPTRLGVFLCYGWGFGWPIPDPFGVWLVSAWNHVACRLFGHEDLLWHMAESGEVPQDDAHCSNCCKPLTRCTGKGLQHGSRWFS